jgi:bacterioferritin (cytochrome b1)
MASNEKLIQLIKKQIEIENEHVKRLTDLENKTDNAAAKLLLLEMKLDSQKHAGILDGILKVISGVPPSKTLWDYRLESYVDQLTVKKALENHIKMETDVLNQVQEQIRQTDDEGIRLLLQHIADDEKKHHKILETIVKNAYKIK